MLQMTLLNTLLRMYNLIWQQNERMRSAKETLSAGLEKLESLQQPPSEDLSSTADLYAAVTTCTQLKKYLCGEATHKYSLELLSEVVNPAYKERAFSMHLQLIDAEGNKVLLGEGIFCKIMLFTTENPPKAIKLNTAGDRALKGDTEVHGNTSFFFRKIAVSDVSSHFRNGCFFLVAMPSDTTDIAPFIMKNFVVKSRKANFEGNPSKKRKVDQDPLSNQ